MGIRDLGSSKIASVHDCRRTHALGSSRTVKQGGHVPFEVGRNTTSKQKNERNLKMGDPENPKLGDPDTRAWRHRVPAMADDAPKWQYSALALRSLRLHATADALMRESHAL